MRNCFVCMPLTDELKPLFSLVSEVIENSPGGPWSCAKADDQRQPGMITDKIVDNLLNADLVIAVAPDPRRANAANPNVMYELGIAHSYRKPCIVIADSKTGLPFDLLSVEAITLDFSRFEEKNTRTSFLDQLRTELRAAIPDCSRLDEQERPRHHTNPVTSHLNGTYVFVEDLRWLWGYCKVLKEEREAETVWEITRDLYWPTEKLFFESIKEAIKNEKKHYFMVPEEEGVLRKVDAIKNQLRIQPDLLPKEIDKYLHFVAIDPTNFSLWPIAIVLYDANFATRRRGILCEPMTSEVGNDPIDKDFQRLSCAEDASELDWIKRRREATFDIALDGRVVESLATAFEKLWDDKIWEGIRKAGDDEEQVALLNRWLIRRRSRG